MEISLYMGHMHKQQNILYVVVLVLLTLGLLTSTIMELIHILVMVAIVALLVRLLRGQKSPWGRGLSLQKQFTLW